MKCIWASWCAVLLFTGCAHVETKRDDLESEALRAFTVSDTTKDAKVKERSDYELATAFKNLKLPFTAFIYFTPLVQAGPTHAFHFQAVEALTELQPILRDDFLIPSTFNNYYQHYETAWRKLPAETQASISYNMARIANRKLKLLEARAFIDAIPRESALFARAETLLASVLSDARYPADDEAARVRNLETALAIVEKNHATLELARINYDAGHLDEARRWYQQEPRYSEAWNHSLFESLPTARVTLACLFVGANSSLADFEKTYLPIAEAITARAVEEPSKNPFAFIDIMTNEKNTDIPAPVVIWLRSHQRTVDTVAMFGELEAEQLDVASRVSWTGEKLTSEVLMYLRLNRETLEKVTAHQIRGQLMSAATAIIDFDQQVKRVQSGELKCK